MDSVSNEKAKQHFINKGTITYQKVVQDTLLSKIQHVIALTFDYV